MTNDGLAADTRLSCRAHALVDALETGLLLSDDGIIRRVGPRLAGRLGGEGDSILSRHVWDFVHTEEFMIRDALVGRTSPTGSVVGRWLTIDDSVLWMEARIVRASFLDQTGSLVLLRDLEEAERGTLISRVFATLDGERRSLARELHDETGQWLTALISGLHALERTVSEHVRDEVYRLRRLSEMASTELRRLARGLHPASLERLGVGPAIESLADTFSERHGVATNLELSPDIGRTTLIPSASLCLYRIAQEALTNVAKHAAATEVTVALRRSDGNVRLDIRDNGCGFDVGDSLPSGTLGLLAMHERASSIGGRFRIDSSAGQGTTVSVEIRTPT